MSRKKSKVLVIKTLGGADAKRLMLLLEGIRTGDVILGPSKVSPLDSRVLKIVYGEKK